MKLRIISVLLALCLGISGCGKESEHSVEEKVETKNEVKQASVGGQISLAMHKPETLNPIYNRDKTVDKVLRLVYEPLFVLDNNMNITPNLAESYTVEGNNVIVKLKANVKWDDGKNVSADDLIYTLRELEKAGLDTIYKYCVENLGSYSKIDDLTVKISYKKGLGSVGYSLCFPIIPKHYFSGKSVDEIGAVGNGSYKFVDYKLVKELNLKASESGLNGRPYINDVKVMIISNDETALSALEASLIDAMTIDINKLGSLPTDLRNSAIDYNTNQFEFIGFNVEKDMFSNLSVRQGLAHLIPREDIIKNIYLNKMTPSITPINPNNYNTSKVGESSYEYDKGLANTLVSAGNRGFNSFNFSILVNKENSSRIESARLICSAFNDVGMNTKVEAVDFQEYQERLKNGQFDMYVGGIVLKENMDIMALAGSSGNMNFGNYKDVNMDKLIGDCNSAISNEGYKACLNELNKYFSVQLPVIGIGFKSEVLVTSGKIKGEKEPTINNIYGNIYKWYIG